MPLRDEERAAEGALLKGMAVHTAVKSKRVHWAPDDKLITVIRKKSNKTERLTLKQHARELHKMMLSEQTKRRSLEQKLAQLELNLQDTSNDTHILQQRMLKAEDTIAQVDNDLELNNRDLAWWSHTTIEGFNNAQQAVDDVFEEVQMIAGTVDTLVDAHNNS